MSVLLYGAGAIAFVVGAVMFGFGIPVHEFSFGNTLILAGIVAMVGGLIIAGLGLIVAQLQQLTEALTRGAPVRAARALTPSDALGRLPAAPARIPFPPRTKVEQGAEMSEMAKHEPSGFEPQAAAPLNNDAASDHLAPMLPNPDAAPVAVEDEVSLSPRHPFVPAAAPADLDEPFSSRADHAGEDRLHGGAPAFEAPWPMPPKLPMSKTAAPKVAAPKPAAPKPAAPKVAQPVAPPPPPQQNTYFDSMWPSEPKAGEPGFDERKEPKEAKAEKPAEAKFQSPFAPPLRAEPKPAPQPLASDEIPIPAVVAAHGDEPTPADEPRTAAILKSGVVDGIGYTLYVDGSIEAELPQGTLRFASINDLRSHLEKAS